MPGARSHGGWRYSGAVIVFPEPMHAPDRLVHPFTDDGWIYEIKHDGYRCMAGIAPGAAWQTARVQLRTKSGVNCTKWYPEVVRALACIPGGPHIIDGEAAVLVEHGVSDFNLMQERAGHRKWYQGAPAVTFCVFDLLQQDGESLLQLPLLERKARLQRLIEPCEKEKGAVLFLGDLPADAKVFQAMVLAGLKVEGVMAKRKMSLYRPGVRSEDWLKIKRPGWREGRRWGGE